MNHIIAHLHSCNDTNELDLKFILRLVSVSHTKDYLLEYDKKYGNSQTIKYGCFYNSSKWYDRLLEDFKYKKFKNIELSEVAEGIWIVKYTQVVEKSFKLPNSKEIYDYLLSGEMKDDMLKQKVVNHSWFDDFLTPYIQRRLTGYNEDFSETNDIITNMENSMGDYKSIPIYQVFSEVYDENSEKRTYMLKHPERHYLKSDQYVLTNNELYSMLICYDYPVYTLKQETNPEYTVSKEPNTNYVTVTHHLQTFTLTTGDKSDFIITKATDGDYFTVNKTSFNENDILQNLKVFGIDLYRYNEIRNSTKYRDIKYQSIKDWEVTGSSLDENPVFPYEKEMGYDLEKFDDSLLNTSLDKTAYYVYIDKILNKRKLSETPHKFLKEMAFVNSIEVETDIAKKFIKHLFENINDEALMSDFAQLITFVENIKFAKSKEETKNPKTDMQRFHTQKYVEKYKDDNAETIAIVALERTYNYLVKHMYLNKESINKNKIGQDLVSLGVKKTRKSQGYFYGLKDESTDLIIN